MLTAIKNKNRKIKGKFHAFLAEFSASCTHLHASAAKKESRKPLLSWSTRRCVRVCDNHGPLGIHPRLQELQQTNLKHKIHGLRPYNFLQLVTCLGFEHTQSLCFSKTESVWIPGFPKNHMKHNATFTYKSAGVQPTLKP